MFVKRGRDLSLCRVQLDKQTNLRHDKKLKRLKITLKCKIKHSEDYCARQSIYKIKGDEQK